jgi:valyl-tRNA synthetase
LSAAVGDAVTGSDSGAGGHREDTALSLAADVLREVRKAKSQARRKMRAPVKRVIVCDTPERLDALELCGGDLREAGAIEMLEQREGEEFAVEIELAEEPTEE